MLKKRIIPCLDIKEGRTVKGINFVDLRDAGDPVELAEAYSAQGADELVFLDITATVDNRSTFIELVENIAKHINIPFTVGGGISSTDQVETLLKAGADKVSVNSAAVRNPELLNDISGRFGDQCLVLAIDANLVNGEWKVFTHGGRRPTELNAIEWAKEGEERGAGEILLTSMRKDGTKSGFDIELTKLILGATKIPVIASGGAGNVEDFRQVFEITDAALAAGIFHFGEIPIPQLKRELRQQNIPVR